MSLKPNEQGLSENEKAGKPESKMDLYRRLNLLLDQTSFENLTKIKKNHCDSSYTQTIKRALAYLAFIEEQKQEGLDVYLIDKKLGEEGQIKKVTMVL